MGRQGGSLSVWTKAQTAYVEAAGTVLAKTKHDSHALDVWKRWLGRRSAPSRSTARAAASPASTMDDRPTAHRGV